MSFGDFGEGPSSGPNSNLCKICEAKPVTGVHYGVQSCEGCKAFYRRTVTKNLCYRSALDCKYRAGAPDLCPFVRCQTCRLEKCMLAGMNLKASVRGRKPKNKRSLQKTAMAEETGELEKLRQPVRALEGQVLCSSVVLPSQPSAPAFDIPDLPRKFSFSSQEHSNVTLDFTLRVEATVAGVASALSATFADQLATKFTFSDDVSTELVTLEMMAEELLKQLAYMGRTARAFLQNLPGLGRIGMESQRMMLIEKWAEIWMVSNAKGWYDNEFHWVIGDKNLRYTGKTTKALMSPQYVTHSFGMLQAVREIGLTDLETFVLLAVVILQPETFEESFPERTVLRFLYAHYVDALLKLVSSRCGGPDGKTKKLRQFLIKVRNVHRPEREYINSCDLSTIPWRGRNDAEMIDVLIRSAQLNEEEPS